MQAQNRVDLLRQALEQALAPSHLHIVDESEEHAGHAGAQGGGHFQVEIVSSAFTGKNAVARHRLVYQALGNLMTTDIHAISIVAKTPAEAS